MKKPINFKAERADVLKISAICDRTEKLAAKLNIRLPIPDRLTLHMDITACHLNGNPLRLDELLAADDANFGHDVFGIVRYMDRETGKLTDCFSPRFTDAQAVQQ